MLPYKVAAYVGCSSVGFKVQPISVFISNFLCHKEIDATKFFPHISSEIMSVEMKKGGMLGMETL